MQNTQGSTTTTEMAYVISDHLGSVWALANETGGFIENYAYDSWGKRVNPTNWSQNDTRTTFKTDRGFTLHEHYDAMQIVNMVARMYDPLLGQFISVDPLADKYPGWGPYVYCMNNPLIYTDPTGEYVYDAEANPELAELVNELRETWENSSDEFKEAFYEYSGMDAGQVDEMLTDGKGPELSLVEDIRNDKGEKANGKFEGKVKVSDGKLVEGTGKISIDSDIADNALKYPTYGKLGATEVFQSTVLHESVHYGRAKNGLPPIIPFFVKECAGKVFEKDKRTYGKDLAPKDAEKDIRTIQEPLKPIPTPRLIP
jgi:RHS repeat-associated protein